MTDPTGAGDHTNPDRLSHPSGPEARQASRKKGVGFHFLLTLDENLQPVDARSVALMDISATGCGLYQVDPVEIGTRFGVVLMRQGQWSAHLGVARHCREEANGWIRVGIQHDPMPAGLEQRLIEYAASCFGFDTRTRRSA